MAFAQLEDVRIHYDLTGSQNAPVLLFSNSLGSTLSMWDPQTPALQKEFRVLRYDTRGHGQSSVTPGRDTIEQLGRDVTRLLDKLELESVYFCGLSMGGQTGMWLALNAPTRLKKLVLSNTAAKIGSPEIWNTRIEAVRKGGMKSISTAVMERWFSRDFRAKSPDSVGSAKGMLESTDPEGYVANCGAVRDYDARKTIAAIRIPTLVVAGTHDAATTPADGRYLAEQIPGARYVEFDAAHLSNIERPERFASELSSFFPAQ